MLPRLGIVLAVFLLAGATFPQPDNWDAASTRLAERYRQLLNENPTAGVALDRLWKLFEEKSATAALLEDARKKADARELRPLLVYGLLLEKAGRANDAVHAFEDAIRADEHNSLPHQALAQLADKSGDHERAAAEWSAALERLPTDDPRRMDALLQAGRAFLAARQPARAAELWEQTTALAPDDISLRQQLASLYEENGWPDKAAPHYEYLAEHGSVYQRAIAWRNLARLRAESGDAARAIPALESAIALTAPDNPLRRAWQSELIRLHQRFGLLTALENRWREAAASHPRDLAACLRLVQLFAETGAPRDEREWLEKAFALSPKDQPLGTRLARLAAQDGDLARAATVLDQLLAAQPANLDLACQRATVFLQQNQPQAATDCVESALARGKQDEQTAARANEFYVAHRLFAPAEKHLRAEREAHPAAAEPALALASFFAAQQRWDECRLTLRQWIDALGGAPEKSAALARVADFWKRQNHSAEHLSALAEAIASDPKSSALRLALADAQTTSGDLPAAQQSLEAALAALPENAERIEAERKLFALLQKQAAAMQPDPRTAHWPPPTVLDAAPPATPLSDYLARLDAAAKREPSAANLLRAARWHLWKKDPETAAKFAQRAVELFPAELGARELLVRILDESGRRREAIAQLEELAKLDPAHRIEHLRRTAQIELTDDRIDRALEICTQLAAENPGSVPALTELAQTQQRAERWLDALHTWEAILALAPSPAEDAFSSYLRALDRLGLHQRAAEALDQRIVAPRDARTQETQFADLLALCQKHQLLPWLAARYTERLAQHPADYFLLSANAAIQKSNGDPRAAYVTLQRAYFVTPNPAETLGALAAAAEELGDETAAIDYQRRLLALAPQPAATLLEKLAQLQEATLDFAAADASWHRVVELFPTELDALEQAADYFEKTEDAAAAGAILRRLVELDPAKAKWPYRLGLLAVRAGNAKLAAEAFEQVLARTPPLGAAAPLKLPDFHVAEAVSARAELAPLRGSMRARTGRATVEPGSASDGSRLPENDADLRLEAVRQLAQLADHAALDSWIKRWKTAAAQSPSEAFWALHFAGANTAALELLRTSLREHPEAAELHQAFIVTALRAGAWRELAQFLWPLRDGETRDRDYFLGALGAMLSANSARPGTAALDELFPPGFDARETLWRTAQVLAEHQRFREAVHLGERVLASAVAQRAAFALEVAHWHLLLLEPERARAVLRSGLEGAGDALDAPIYEVLRQYFTLLPAPEREPFIEAFDAELTRRHEPIHRATALALLHGLNGETAAAKRDLARLADFGNLRSNDADPDEPALNRWWNSLLVNGSQLERWNLPALAEFVWSKALEDEALIRLQGDAAVRMAATVRMRLLLLRTGSARPAELEALLDDFFARKPAADVLTDLGTQITATGENLLAVKFYTRLLPSDRANAMIFRRLCEANRAVQDDRATAALRDAWHAGLPFRNPTERRDAALALADMREAGGDRRGSEEVLSAAAGEAGSDPMFASKLAQLLRTHGKLRDAEETLRQLLRRDSANETAQRELASLLEQRGKRREATECWESVRAKSRGAEPAADLALVRLALDRGRVEEAFARARRLVRPAKTQLIVELAMLFVRHGERARASRLLDAALRATADPAAKCALREFLLAEVCSPADEPERARAELVRLCETTRSDPAQRVAVQQLELRLARKYPDAAFLVQALREDWALGEGDFTAGASLALLAVERKQAPEFAATLARLRARAAENENASYAFANDLLEEKRFAEAAQIAEPLRENFPQSNANVLLAARALALAGRRAEADSLVQELSARRCFEPGILGEIGRFYLALEDAAAARRWLAEFVATDPAGHQSPYHLEFIRTLLAAGEIAPAKKALALVIAHNPPAETWELVAQLLDAGGSESVFRELQMNRAAADRTRLAFCRRLLARDDARGALAYLQAHAQLVALEPALAAALEKIAVAEHAHAAVAALFDSLLAQGDAREPFVRHAAANVQQAWGETLWTAGAPAEARAHFERATALAPDDLALARRQGDFLVGKQEPQLAAAVWQRFVAATDVPEEREAAAALLAALPRT